RLQREATGRQREGNETATNLHRTCIQRVLNPNRNCIEPATKMQRERIQMTSVLQPESNDRRRLVAQTEVEKRDMLNVRRMSVRLTALRGHSSLRFRCQLLSGQFPRFAFGSEQRTQARVERVLVRDARRQTQVGAGLIDHTQLAAGLGCQLL